MLAGGGDAFAAAGALCGAGHRSSQGARNRGTEEPRNRGTASDRFPVNGQELFVEGSRGGGGGGGGR